MAPVRQRTRGRTDTTTTLPQRLLHAAVRVVVSVWLVRLVSNDEADAAALETVERRRYVFGLAVRIPQEIIEALPQAKHDARSSLMVNLNLEQLRIRALEVAPHVTRPVRHLCCAPRAYVQRCASHRHLVYCNNDRARRWQALSNLTLRCVHQREVCIERGRSFGGTLLRRCPFGGSLGWRCRYGVFHCERHGLRTLREWLGFGERGGVGGHSRRSINGG